MCCGILISDIVFCFIKINWRGITMKEVLSLESLGISYEFPEEINILASEHKSANSIPKEYPSVYDYIAILFYYRFVEKLENREIAEILDVAPTNVLLRLYDYGWHYNKDYDINKELHEKELKVLNEKFQVAKQEIFRINFEKYDLYRSVKLSQYYIRMRKRTWDIGGCKNKEEFLKYMFYFTQISKEKLSPKEMAWIFGIRVNAIQRRLEQLGIGLSYDEAMENKKQRGTQDYGATMRAGKATRIKALQKSATSGSMNECYFRDELSLVIYDYFYEDYYEVVIGTNAVGIIKDKEIDIPVIVFNSSNGACIKIAVEYNGEEYHKEEDIKKLKLLKESNWIYYEVIERNNDGSHRGIKFIKEKAREAAKELKVIVENEMRKCM